MGRLLDRYGIPFYYEQPRLVYDRGQYHVWRPDFTLPQYNDFVLEYAGMPDRLDYMMGVRFKEQVYTANGIPALFVYPKDLSGPNWPEELYARTAHLGERAVRSSPMKRTSHEGTFCGKTGRFD